MVRYGLTLGLSLVLASSAAAESPSHASPGMIGPQSSSDEARAARPGAPEPALMFDVRDEYADAPRGAQSAAVTLSRSFTEVVSGTRHSLDDRTLCRAFDWTAGGRDFSSLSCYAEPVFKANELANRRTLGRALGALHAGDVPELTDEYWAQAELGVVGRDHQPIKIAVKPNSEVEARLGDRVVVRFVGTAGAVSAEERAEFVRYAARHLPLHPDMRRILAAATDLPARIEVDLAQGKTIRRRVFSISALRRGQANYPLPAGLTSRWRAAPEGDPNFIAGVRSALDAADGRTHPPTLDAIAARIQDAGTHGRGLEAVLGAMNLALQYPAGMNGPDGQQLRQKIGPALIAARQDPEAVRFLQVSSAAGSATASGQEAAAKALSEETAMDALPFGAFRYVTFANLVVGSRDASKWDPAILKAMPRPLVDNYWRAIAGYPWASGFYKDCGSAYLADFDPVDAWLAFDLGRAADPDWRAGPMAGVATMEAQIRNDQPDYF